MRKNMSLQKTTAVRIKILKKISRMAFFVVEYNCQMVVVVSYAFKKKNIYIFDNNQEAVAFLKTSIQPSDTLLLKASNSLNFTEICDAIC